ncbi:alpha-1,2-fucosyltransferase [Pseudovibrio sp. Ad26]|uniref:alpha-1,2-fucosyltransferase n=1 Tax=Pseudovibrio sp. Ad26 TaxID=989410 RepID=UPI0007AE5A42|nr:alpha-1,2-fucosyltransferase [Pseudovibrio sp. Ad26]KZL14073.1 Glycosyl transferase family 11 [Pseudovibrio sp. Ad26]
MIIVNLKGRLGNQLFQWAAARYLADASKSEIVLYSGERDRKAGRTPPLMGFPLPTRVAQPKDFRKVFFPFGKFSKQLQQVSLHVRAFKTRQILSLDELEAARRSPSKNYFLNGYFMSSHIADAIRKTLQQDLNLLDFTPSRYPYLDIVDHPRAVALHIRRGDFATGPARQSYGLCSVEYYLRSLQTLEDKIGPAKPVVFSDDISWCEDVLAHLPNVAFFKAPTDGRDFEDMMLMSRCAHQIIANSTYSWWAAYLNKNPEKQVFAPYPWRATKEHQNQYFLPENWQRVAKYASSVSPTPMLQST